MATLPFSGAGRRVTRMVRRPRSWFVLGVLAVIGSGALAAIQNQLPVDGGVEQEGRLSFSTDRHPAVERPPTEGSTLAVHRRVDRGQRAKPLTAAELGLSQKEHAELLAPDGGEAPQEPEEQPSVPEKADVADLPAEEPLVEAQKPENAGSQSDSDDALVLDDEVIVDEPSADDEKPSTSVIMPPPFVPPADGKTKKPGVETPSDANSTKSTPPKNRPSWHGLIQVGKLVTNQKGRGKPPKLPFLEQYPAKQYCLNLGKERVYGLRSWRLATPGEIKGFLKKSGLVRGRYWTTARWKNRARAIAVPSGRSSSEHVSRKKLRPFCVARVR